MKKKFLIEFHLKWGDAIKTYSRVVKASNEVDAQLCLSMHYYENQGVNIDFSKCIEVFNLAYDFEI